MALFSDLWNAIFNYQTTGTIQPSKPATSNTSSKSNTTNKTTTSNTSSKPATAVPSVSATTQGLLNNRYQTTGANGSVATVTGVTKKQSDLAESAGVKQPVTPQGSTTAPSQTQWTKVDSSTPLGVTTPSNTNKPSSNKTSTTDDPTPTPTDDPVTPSYRPSGSGGGSRGASTLAQIFEAFQYNPMGAEALASLVEKYMPNYDYSFLDEMVKAYQGSADRSLASLEESFSNLLKSLSDAKNRNTREFAKGRSTISENAYDNSRNLMAQLASRGLAGSGLQQLGEVQNRMETGNQMSNLANEYYEAIQNLMNKEAEATSNKTAQERNIESQLAQSLANVAGQRGTLKNQEEQYRSQLMQQLENQDYNRQYNQWQSQFQATQANQSQSNWQNNFNLQQQQAQWNQAYSQAQLELAKEQQVLDQQLQKYQISQDVQQQINAIATDPSLTDGLRQELANSLLNSSSNFIDNSGKSNILNSLGKMSAETNTSTFINEQLPNITSKQDLIETVAQFEASGHTVDYDAIAKAYGDTALSGTELYNAIMGNNTKPSASTSNLASLLQSVYPSINNYQNTGQWQ